MGVVILDGSTVRDFVNDSDIFKKSIKESFVSLDINRDGVLSRSELRTALETLRLVESHFGADVATPPEELSRLYDSVFDGFDFDRSGTVDFAEFEAEMRKILLAVADGLGFAPIQMVLDDESLLQQAADLEASKLSGSN